MTILLNERLHVPAVFDEVDGQPVEQFGVAGHSPWAPKSAAVATRPVPKNICQMRFTATRAVSGCSRIVIHWARPRRLAGAPVGQRRQDGGRAGRDFFGRLRVVAAIEDEGLARLGGDRPSPSWGTSR